MDDCCLLLFLWYGEALDGRFLLVSIIFVVWRGSRWKIFVSINQATMARMGPQIKKNYCIPVDTIVGNLYRVRIRVMAFNATFNNISVISWRSVLLVEETGVPGENR